MNEVDECFSPHPIARAFGDIATRIGMAATTGMRIVYPVEGDNRSNIQAALDASEYRPVRFFPGFYKCAGGLTVRRGTTVHAGGAFIWCDTAGLDRAIDLSDDSTWLGGKVTCNRLSGGLSADDHCCFRVGHYADGVGVRNVAIRGVELDVIGYSGVGILVTGPTRNVSIDGVIYGDSDQLAVVVCLHWGYRNQPELGTFHPHNVSVRNVSCGKLGNSKDASSEATPVSVSACYNVSIENVHAEQARFGALYVTGDYGYKYSGFPYTPGSVSSRNVTCKRATVAGVWSNNWGTNTGTVNPGFVSFSDCTMFGGPTAEAGAYLDRSHNARFDRCVFAGFPVGVQVIGEAAGNEFRGCSLERNALGKITQPHPGVSFS